VVHSYSNKAELIVKTFFYTTERITWNRTDESWRRTEPVDSGFLRQDSSYRNSVTESSLTTKSTTSPLMIIGHWAHPSGASLDSTQGKEMQRRLVLSPIKGESTRVDCISFPPSGVKWSAARMSPLFNSSIIVNVLWCVNFVINLFIYLSPIIIVIEIPVLKDLKMNLMSLKNNNYWLSWFSWSSWSVGVIDFAVLSMKDYQFLNHLLINFRFYSNFLFHWSDYSLDGQGADYILCSEELKSVLTQIDHTLCCFMVILSIP